MKRQETTLVQCADVKVAGFKGLHKRHKTVVLTATEGPVQHWVHAGPRRPHEALFIGGSGFCLRAATGEFRIHS